MIIVVIVATVVVHLDGRSRSHFPKQHFGPLQKFLQFEIIAVVAIIVTMMITSVMATIPSSTVRQGAVTPLSTHLQR
jgi:hypothetical protein